MGSHGPSAPFLPSPPLHWGDKVYNVAGQERGKLEPRITAKRILLYHGILWAYGPLPAFASLTLGEGGLHESAESFFGLPELSILLIIGFGVIKMIASRKKEDRCDEPCENSVNGRCVCKHSDK